MSSTVDHETPKFPFPAREATLPMPEKAAAWWQKAGKYPVTVSLRGEAGAVAGSAYRITRRPDGSFTCTRPQGGIPVGEIFEYGVRNALTETFFNELSALRAVIFHKSYPAPVAYEMAGHELVHPGPCFDAHPGTRILRTKFKLGESSAALCSVCQERFL